MLRVAIYNFLIQIIHWQLNIISQISHTIFLCPALRGCFLNSLAMPGESDFQPLIWTELHGQYGQYEIMSGKRCNFVGCKNSKLTFSLYLHYFQRHIGWHVHVKFKSVLFVTEMHVIRNDLIVQFVSRKYTKLIVANNIVNMHTRCGVYATSEKIRSLVHDASLK